MLIVRHIYEQLAGSNPEVAQELKDLVPLIKQNKAQVYDSWFFGGTWGIIFLN